MEHQPGDIVWAKMRGYPHWPAKVVPKRPREKSPSATHVFVFFYGSHQVAWIPGKDVCSYEENKKRYRNVNHRSGFGEAVWEAEEDPDLKLSEAQSILQELLDGPRKKGKQRKSQTPKAKSKGKDSIDSVKDESVSTEDQGLATPSKKDVSKETSTPIRRSARLRPDSSTPEERKEPERKEPVKQKRVSSSPLVSPPLKPKKEKDPATQPQPHHYSTRHRNQTSEEPLSLSFREGPEEMGVAVAAPPKVQEADESPLPAVSKNEAITADLHVCDKLHDVIIDDVIIDEVDMRNLSNENMEDDKKIENNEKIEDNEKIEVDETMENDKKIEEGNEKVQEDEVDKKIADDNDVIGQEAAEMEPLDILETVVELKSENESHVTSDDLQVKIIDRTVESSCAPRDATTTVLPDGMVLEPMETDMVTCMSEVEIIPDSIANSSSDPIIRTTPSSQVHQEPPTAQLVPDIHISCPESSSAMSGPLPDPSFALPDPSLHSLFPVINPLLPVTPDAIQSLSVPETEGLIIVNTTVAIEEATPITDEVQGDETVLSDTPPPPIALPLESKNPELSESVDGNVECPLEHPKLDTVTESKSVEPSSEVSDNVSSGHDRIRTLRAGTKRGRVERMEKEKIEKAKPKRNKTKRVKTDAKDTMEQENRNEDRGKNENEDTSKNENEDTGKNENEDTGKNENEDTGKNENRDTDENENGKTEKNETEDSEKNKNEANSVENVPVDEHGGDGENMEIGNEEDVGNEGGSIDEDKMEVSQCNGDIFKPVKAKVVPITDPPASPKLPEKKKHPKPPRQVAILPSMTMVEALKAYHHNLQASLVLGLADTTIALKHLRDLIDLQFTTSDIEEVKELVDTLRKIRRFKANSRVKNRAEELYSKIKSLYIKGEVRPNPKQQAKKDKLARQRPQSVVTRINQAAKENREKGSTGEEGGLTQRRSRRSRTKVNYTELSGGLDNISSGDDQTVPGQ